MKNKAFTLIELLAVIIILGILMLIAIPSVTNYINNSRKNTYVGTANEFVKAASIKVNSGDLDINDTDTIYYIPVGAINTEGAKKSPYGDFEEAYIGVTFNGEEYTYYWVSMDTAGMGTKNLIKISDLSSDSIESNVTSEDIEISKLANFVKKYRKYEENLDDYTDGINEEAMNNLSIIGELGDYVQMYPTLESFDMDSSYTGYAKTLDIKYTNVWRIINIKEDNTIEMLADMGLENVQFNASTSTYMNYTSNLNKLAQLYLNDKYTISARNPGYDGQILELNPDKVNFSTDAPRHSTDSTSDEAKGEGDLKYVKDLELIKNALGTLDSPYGNKWFLSSRYYVYFERPGLLQWTWGGTSIAPGEEFYPISIFAKCTNSCASGSGWGGNIRPIVVLKANLKVKSGEGTITSPYILE